MLSKSKSDFNIDEDNKNNKTEDMFMFMLRQKNVSNDFQMYFQKMLNVMYSKKCDKVLLSISHTCTMFCCHKVVM